MSGKINHLSIAGRLLHYTTTLLIEMIDMAPGFVCKESRPRVIEITEKMMIVCDHS